MRKMRIFLFQLLFLGLVVLFAIFVSNHPLIKALRIHFAKFEVGVAGTGSMFPTFPKGSKESLLTDNEVDSVEMYAYPGEVNFFGKTYLKRKISYLDIVAIESEVSNKITLDLHGKATGLLKRVIGIEGDKIEFRSGYVYRNGEKIDEKYISRQGATHGSTYFPDCKIITIPKGQVFVLGDNRQESLDSRFELGLVNENDIHFGLDFASQEKLYSQRWADNLNSSKPLEPLTSEQILDLINSIRIQNNRKKLRFETKLADSAKIRAGAILDASDYSFEATKAAYTMKEAMQKVGYDNIVWGEIPLSGRFSADELTSRLTSFPESKKFLLEADFSDFGLSDFESANSCPQIITVLHFAGYKKANYSKETIKNWEEAIVSIEKVSPSWIAIVPNLPDQKRELVKNMIEKLDAQNVIAHKILEKMLKSEWLSQKDKDQITKFTSLGGEIEEIAKQINEP